MIDGENILNMLIGKTISDIICIEEDEANISIKLLTTDGNIFNIHAYGGEDVFMSVYKYMNVE